MCDQRSGCWQDPPDDEHEHMELPRVLRPWSFIPSLPATGQFAQKPRSEPNGRPAALSACRQMIARHVSCMRCNAALQASRSWSMPQPEDRRPRRSET